MTAPAPYIYHGNKIADERIYAELKDLPTYEAYDVVRERYKKYFVNSRPYRATVTGRGVSRFPSEWGKTLKNLKTMYGYEPPKKPKVSYGVRDFG
jgi:hypothetical protein